MSKADVSTGNQPSDIAGADFRAYLEYSATAVASEIERMGEGWFESADKKARHRLSAELKLLGSSLRGGKLLRGTLVRLGYELAGGRAPQDTLAAAAAFEILHAGLLIHDDVIDKSPLRRGKPSVQAALGNNHQALSQAVCLGDVAFFLAARVISDSGLDPKLKNDVLARFASVALDTLLGEMIDVKLAAPASPKLEPDVEDITRLKTAAYSFIGPLTIGALIAGADGRLLAALERYGEHIGLAFQLQDDILGVFGLEQTTGKSAASDIQENKNTLLISYALENADAPGRQILIDYYGKGALTAAELAAVRGAIDSSGALAYSRRRAEESVIAARAIINEITNDQHYRRVLSQLADFCLSRQN